MYIKLFPNRSPEEVMQLAQHSQEIAMAIKDCDLVIFPEVLACDFNSISYSLVNCQNPFLNKVLNLESTPDELERIGSILRLIHNLGINHSDFVPHNLFLSGDRFVLIDPHPPDILDFDHNLLYSNSRIEVSGFVFSLLTDTGLKQSLKSLHHQFLMVRSFLNGYGKSELRILDIFWGLNEYAKGVFIQKRRVGFSLAHSSAHVFVGWMISFFLICAAL